MFLPRAPWLKTNYGARFMVRNYSRCRKILGFPKHQTVLTVVDVLSPDGKFTSRRKLLCPGNPLNDGIHFLPGEKVMVVLGAMDAYRREVDSTTGESQGADEAVHELVCCGVE